MDHHAPHPNAAFEGYYNKFSLPSGAHLVIVISKVYHAKQNGNKLSFTYVPKDATKSYQKEISVDTLDMRRLKPDGNAFILDIPGIGYAKWNDDESTEYHLEHEDFYLGATTTSRTPWSKETSTPEGLLVNLPLPLHWHVQSLSSRCKYTMKIPNYELPAVDNSGEATVHQEKNWAHSFPAAHMWIQARDGDSGFCCAGGQTIGMEAFLVGYRSKDLNIDFRPPLAVRFAGLGPFMSYSTDWDNRTFELSIQSFRQKLTVKAVAPKDSFISLSAPFPEGHRKNFLGESFQARLAIQIYESGWLSPWKLVREEEFEGASLEFGAAFYPPAGSEKTFN